MLAIYFKIVQTISFNGKTEEEEEKNNNNKRT